MSSKKPAARKSNTAAPSKVTEIKKTVSKQPSPVKATVITSNVIETASEKEAIKILTVDDSPKTITLQSLLKKVQNMKAPIFNKFVKQ